MQPFRRVSFHHIIAAQDSATEPSYAGGVSYRHARREKEPFVATGYGFYCRIPICVHTDTVIHGISKPFLGVPMVARRRQLGFM